ncbi:hypothetical protein JCM24511_02540, partial [Saitozyma sp. JCM 24511]
RSHSNVTHTPAHLFLFQLSSLSSESFNTLYMYSHSRLSRPFAVISKLGVRYTGIFDHISQEDQTICLSQVYNHGTEDRPTAKKLPGSATTLGWVRFHTESIESIALVENYVPPGGEQPVDPILASVVSATRISSSHTHLSHLPPSRSVPIFHPPFMMKHFSDAVAPAPAPSAVPAAAAAAVAPAPPLAPVPAAASSSRSPLRHDLPSRPSGSANSAATALDRVQQSLSELSVNGGAGGARPRRQPYAPRAPGPAHPIEVPDTEFDFSKGTEALEAERTARKAAGGETGKGKGKSENGDHGDIETPTDEGEPELPPHPIAVQPASNGIGNGHGPDAATSPGAGPAGRKGSASGSSAYVKSSFFDTLSGESSRVSRAEERGRNYDTFGEAGGQDGAYGGRGRGAYGGGARGGRGGYGRGGYGQGQGGYGQGGQGQFGGGGYNRGRGFGGVGGGYRGRGGYGQSQTQSQAGAQQ